MKYRKIRKGNGHAFMLITIISLIILFGACNSFRGDSIEGEWIFNRVNIEEEIDDFGMLDSTGQEVNEFGEMYVAAMFKGLGTGRRFEFNDANSFIDTHMGIAVNGKYEINNGSELVLHYDLANKEEEKYKFKINGDSLYLTPIPSSMQFQMVFARFK